MRWLVAPAWAVFMAAGLSSAQEAAPVPATPPPFFPGAPDDSLLLPSPLSDPKLLWKNDGPDYHFTADVGFDMLWTRLSGPGPAFGPNVSLGAFNDRGLGIGASWMQFEQSTSKSGPTGLLRK